MDTNHAEHDRLAEESITADVKEYGWHVCLFESNGYLPPFAYTIGLFETYGHPELISFGLSTSLLHSLFNTAHDLIKEGQKITTGRLYDEFLEGYPVQFITVAKELYPRYFGYGKWYYKGYNFPAFQLIWPSKDNEFPSDKEPRMDLKLGQPLLDRNKDFHFFEEWQLGVYTTSEVLEGKPILYVYHNDDGDWQFHSEDEPELSHAKLVCLDTLVSKDPSLNELYYLPYGSSASRKSKYDKWEIAENSPGQEA